MSRKNFKSSAKAKNKYRTITHERNQNHSITLINYTTFIEDTIELEEHY